MQKFNQARSFHKQSYLFFNSYIPKNFCVTDYLAHPWLKLLLGKKELTIILTKDKISLQKADRVILMLFFKGDFDGTIQCI